MEYDLNKKRKLVESLLNSSSFEELEPALLEWNENIIDEFYKIYQLIEETGYIEDFINNPSQCRALYLDIGILKLMHSGNINKYLENPSKFPEYNIEGYSTTDIVFLSGEKPSDFFNKSTEEILSFGMPEFALADLIIATGLSRDFLYNKPIKLHSLLGNSSICYLIENSELTEEVLNKPTEELLSLHLSGGIISLLLEKTKLVETFLKRPSKELVSLGLYGASLVKLIINANLSREFLEKPIDEFHYLGLLGKPLVSLIQNAELEKDFLDKPIDELHSLELSDSDIIELIKSAKLEKEFLCKSPEKLHSLNLSGADILVLIGNSGMVLEFSEKSEQELLDLGLSNSEISGLKFLSKVAEDYLEKPIKNFPKPDIRQLFLFIKEPKFAKKFFKRPIEDIYSLLQKRSNKVFDLITESGLTKEFLEICLEESRDLKILNDYIICLIHDAKLENEFSEKPDNELLYDMRLSSNNIRILKKESELNNELLKENKKYSVIGLDPKMTLGIEIETEESFNEMSESIINSTKLLQSWQTCGDTSLNNGCEVTSPILTDNNKNVNEIYSICKYLQNLRSKSIGKMWRTYTYRSRLLNKSRIIY